MSLVIRLIFLCFLLIPLLTSAQIVFEKTYGTLGDERGKAIVQLRDSSYVVVGSSSGFANSSDLLLLRVDSTGETMWNKTRGGFNIERGEDIVITSDGMLAMVGYTNSYGEGGYDVYFLKADFDGNVVLEKTYGGTDWDLGYALTETSDGGFVITGETYSQGAGKNDAFILKVDALGDSIWAREFGGTEEEVGYSILEAQNGDLLIAAETSSFGLGKKDGWIVRTDANGNEIWNQTYGGTEDDIMKDLIQLTSGNLMMVMSTQSIGSGNFDIQLSKLNHSGNILLNAIVGGSESDVAESIVQWTRNSGVIVAGGTRSYGAPDAHDLFFFGADTSGINYTLNCPSFALGDIGEDMCFDVIETLDSGYVLCGTRLNGTGYSSVYLAKFDNNCATSGTVIDEELVASIDAPSIQIEFHPNPAEDWIHLSTQSNINHVWLWSLTGTLIGCKKLNGIRETDLSLRSLGAITNGMYFLQLETEEGKTTRKITLE